MGSINANTLDKLIYDIEKLIVKNKIPPFLCKKKYELLENKLDIVKS